MGSKKHKKHKSERREHREDRMDFRPQGLRLILKVAGSSTSTPEHVASPGEYISDFPPESREKHKKSKKKKKKKEKDREKKHKHHKEKRHRIKEESSQEDFSIGEETSQNPFYANLSTMNSIASRPATKPMVPLKSPEPPPSLKLEDSIQSPLAVFLQSPTSQSSSSKLFVKSDTRDSLSPRPLSESGREPRSCVRKQSRTPLAKLLEHLNNELEKRDTYHYFDLPVTDEIAPNYSAIISKPMDFLTIREKISENEYKTIGEFADDFKLMCRNALKYNHPETVYHKAAKTLLRFGQKLLQPESLVRILRPLRPLLRELTPNELGFELPTGGEDPEPMDSADEAIANAVDEEITAQEQEEEKRKQIRLENNPKSKFEAFVDDMTSDEILSQVQTAAASARNKVLRKKVANQMGFVRQRKDGTTSMKILVADENTGPEKVITIGGLVGKLKQGTGQLHSFREDRRNIVKAVKPINYGAFSSFAPIFDSRFSHLTKEESDLVFNTYGDEAGADYAKSIMEFTQDCPYAYNLANGLLNVLTNDEHRKTMDTLMENSRQRHEQQQVEKSLPTDDEKYLNVKIDFDGIRTLQDIGIETDFLEPLEMQMRMFEFQKKLQMQLDTNMALLDQLHQVQNERLSAPPPAHLSHIQHPSPSEIQLANQITANIADIAKQLPPGAIADPHGLRKAMGLTSIGLEPVYDPNEMTIVPPPLGTNESVEQQQQQHQEPNELGDQIDTTPMDMELEGSGGNDSQMDIELRDILDDF